VVSAIAEVAVPLVAQPVRPAAASAMALMTNRDLLRACTARTLAVRVGQLGLR
jgi:hypothetical protein